MYAAEPPHTPPETDQWERFQAWVNEHTPRVNQMQKPLTIDQYLKLQKKIDEATLTAVLEGMENRADLLKKYTSANLTIQTWAKNQKPSTSHATANPSNAYEKARLRTAQLAGQ